MDTRTTREHLDQPATDQEAFILLTKLAIPPARSGTVERSRLVSTLEQGMRGPLTLLAASAGFGKTTLLSSVIQNTHYPAAWLSLDQGDNDLTRFWLYVCAALDTIHPGISAGVVSLYHAPQQPSIEVILTVLINSLTRLQQDSLLILDDYHLITLKPIHTSLTFLLDHLPPRLHLVLSTRVDPPLPLARLRTRGQLTELRTEDLRFTTAETTLFFEKTIGCELSSTDIQVLETRTEGWIAGLQLAALSLQGRANVTSFITAFSGSHRYVVDYLVQEVLIQQSEAVQHFLLQTAILERLNGSLCEAVTGLPDGQAMLEYIEQAHLFLLPLDEEQYWYRYHRLFADVLRHRLSREQATLVPILHQRASVWYEKHGFLFEAISHALDCSDFEHAAAIIQRIGGVMARRGELTTVHTWLQRLPEEVIWSRPTLCIIQTWTAFSMGHFDEARQLLQRIEQEYSLNIYEHVQKTDIPREQLDLLGEVAAVHTSLSMMQMDVPRTIQLAQQALKYLSNNATSLGLVTWLLGLAYWLVGDLAAASQAIEQAYANSLRINNAYFAFMTVHELASLQYLQGHLHQAERIYQQAFEVAATYSEQAIMAGPIRVGMGGLQREWNNLDGASHLLEEGIEQCLSMKNARVALQGYMELALLKLAQGKHEDVQMLQVQFAQLANHPNLPAISQPYISAFQARLALRQANIATASRWAQDSGLYESGELKTLYLSVYLIFARILIAEHKTREAFSWLERLLPLAAFQGRSKSTIEIFLVQALAYRAEDQYNEARKTIQRALALAEEEGYKRLFVDEGALMLDWLEQIRDDLQCRERAASEEMQDTPSLAYIDQLLAVFHEEVSSETQTESIQHAVSIGNGDAVIPSLQEDLSERELEILRLIVAGQSNREIAATLVLAVSTVKWYINTIYSKLQVESRTKAIARARAWDLV